MVTLKSIGIGRTAETFKTKQGRALKLFYDFMDKDTVEYEYGISKKVAGVCLCAPAVYGLIKRGERTGIEYELIRGRRLVELFLKHPFRVKGLARRMGFIHGKIHEHSIKELKSAFAVYKESIEHYPHITDEIRSHLLRFIKHSRQTALCHGDYHPENILVNEEDEFKVIDWINAFSGDPLADVARTVYLMQSGKSPEKKSLVTKLLESMFRSFIAKAYLKNYFENRVIPKKELRIWDVVIRINRYYENIPEEKEYLRRTIKRSLQKIW